RGRQKAGPKSRYRENGLRHFAARFCVLRGGKVASRSHIFNTLAVVQENASGWLEHEIYQPLRAINGANTTSQSILGTCARLRKSFTFLGR
ncbi:hypothetical protein RM190_19670, partial [Paracoccus sp. CPCC 101403]